MLLHTGAHSVLGRQNAKEGELTSADDWLAVDQHRELSIMSTHGLYGHAELPAQVGRHPGSLNRRDSIRAATDRDRHADLLSP